MASFSLDTTPLSFYALTGAVGLNYCLSFLKNASIASYLGPTANLQPRNNMELVDKLEKCPPEVRARLLRMDATQLNGFESLPIFATAVLAGNHAGLDTKFMNVASLSYVALRVLYAFIYINQTKTWHASLRTLTFASGFGICMTMLVKAGNAMAAK